MMFCDKMISDSLVMYMRFLTSGYLKANAILYENYLDNGYTIDLFCSKEVEPIDREADQVFNGFSTFFFISYRFKSLPY